jgi:hypothetical protein
MLRFYFYHWVDTSAGELLVLDGFLLPVLSVSALALALDIYLLLTFTVI